MLHSPADEYFTPRPSYVPDARPAQRRAKFSFRRPVFAASAIACIGLLAVSTTFPAFQATSAAGAPASSVSQHLLGARALTDAGVLDAIGATEVGVDFGELAKFSTEGGLVDPETLTSTELRLPFDTDWPLTDGFAYRTAPVEQFHDAQDIAAIAGTPVLAIGSGVIIDAGYATDGCGFSLKIQHLVGGNLLTSRYCHMQPGSHDYVIGDTINIGDDVGRVGNSGLSFGPHLHLALRLNGTPIDPLPYLDRHITSQTA